VKSIVLEPVDGDALPHPQAGQYLTLRVPGAGDPAPVRSYSLSSAPDASAYRLSVRREPHGVVSGGLSTSLRPAAVLDVAAPRGEFVLSADGAEPVVLVSAGIGVTPVMAMLHQLAEARGDREVWWLHVARGPREHAFAREAAELLDALPNARARIFYTG